MKLKRKKKEYIYIYKVYYKTKMKKCCYICWEKVDIKSKKKKKNGRIRRRRRRSEAILLNL